MTRCKNRKFSARTIKHIHLIGMLFTVTCILVFSGEQVSALNKASDHNHEMAYDKYESNCK